MPAKKAAAGKKGSVVAVAEKGKGKGKGKQPPSGLGKKGSAHPAKASNVIYLGHIPQGFFESQMRKFFSQFGVVRRVKLFRSKKTGGSKGYGFVEFEDAATATVTAEAMDGYFLAERQLKCHVVPNKELHSGMFAKPQSADAKAEEEMEEGDDEDEEKEAAAPVVDTDKEAKQAKKVLNALQAKQKKLQAMGIDFELFK